MIDILQLEAKEPSNACQPNSTDGVREDNISDGCNSNSPHSKLNELLSNKPVPVDIVQGPQLTNYRILISESDLLKTHAKEMYLYLSKNLRYEKKIKINKEQLLTHSFQSPYADIEGKISKKKETDKSDTQTDRKSVV